MSGKKIKDFRKARGLSQQKLADEIGWSRQQVSRYELGKVKNPTLAFMQTVANVLEVSVEELLNDD